MNSSLESLAPYEYAFKLPGENGFSPQEFRQWTENKGRTIVGICFIYVIAIFGIQRMMQKRRPFELKSCLVAWNIGLAIFSIVGFLRSFPEFYHATFINGLHYSVCIPSSMTVIPTTSYWTFLMLLSKVAEMGDTIFLVLRKKPLIFLHWYHHVTVLLCIYRVYVKSSPTGRWFGTMNAFVHCFMYSYYAARAIGYRSPKFVSIALTSAQIAQMIVGCIVNYWAYSYLNTSNACQITYQDIVYCTFLYFTYLLLFARFFYQSYINTGKKIKPKTN